MGDKKLERFLPKNQHIQRKLLNFEFWINGKLSKLVIKKLILAKIGNNKTCAPKLLFFNDEKLRKLG